MRIAVAFVCVISICALSGCVAVKPWEKEHLASPLMRTSVIPECEKFNLHVFDSKEATSAGYGAGGGGCGCN